MTVIANDAQVLLGRDITEALLRLKLARLQRDLKEVEACEKKLNWLLDRFAANVKADK